MTARNKHAAEFAGTIASALFVMAIPCAIITFAVLVVTFAALTPFLGVVYLAHEARRKADTLWNCADAEWLPPILSTRTRA